MDFYFINETCTTCPEKQSFNYDTNRCECESGFYVINGACGKCQDGWEYNPVTSCCFWKNPCYAHEVLVNNVCQCATGYTRDSNGFCEPISFCPAFSTYSPASGCCTCNSGYNVQNSQCVPQIQCIENSYLKNGLCYCNEGYALMRNIIQCRKCTANEIYNGEDCVCAIGYARDSTGICAKKNLVLTCGANEAYDAFYKTCLCHPNYNRVNGQCQFSVICG